jgi:glycosyltransferase involved in cell wall biosynthesis
MGFLGLNGCSKGADCQAPYPLGWLGLSTPLVTLGITCFNAAETIGRAILSAKGQDWPTKEIIVVDDASTDASWATINDLARHDPEIRVIRHRVNRGLAGAENTIIGEARGDFVAMFDDDDESIPQRVSAQWHRIVKYEHAHQRTLILCYSRAIGRSAPEPHGVVVADHLLGLGSDPQFVWGLFGSCTVMARRETFLALGPFDETFRRCAEWDLAIRAAFKGAHFISVDKPLVITHKTSGEDKAGNIPLKYALQLRTKYKKYLMRRNVYWSSRAIAYHNFYGNRGRNWRSGAYLTLACVASPVFVLNRLRQKDGIIALTNKFAKYCRLMTGKDRRKAFQELS